MNYDLSLLRCPGCGADFVHHTPFPDRMYSLLSCARCGDYPVIDGIARLLDDVLRRPLVAQLRAGNTETALAMALEWPSLGRTAELRRKLLRVLSAFTPVSLARTTLTLKRALVQRLHERDKGFCSMIASLDPGLWGEWIRYRFSMPALQPLYVLRHMLLPRRPTLEVGASFGHSAWLVARVVGESELWCMDRVFSYVWLLRACFARGARVVCADAERGLPFAAAAFEQIVASDTVHFLQDKTRFGREVGRVTKTSARVLLSHLANALVPRPWHGSPLAPARYRALLEGFEVRMYSNELLHTQRRQGGFDPGAHMSDSELAGVHGLSLLAWRGSAPQPVALDFSPGPYPLLNPRLTAREDVAGVRISPGPVSAPYRALEDDRSPPIARLLEGARLQHGQLRIPRAYQREALLDLLVIDAPQHYAESPRVCFADDS